jgi:RimJ/RimL family protein N-acetyltransferase
MLGRPVRRALAAGTPVRMDDVGEVRMQQGDVALRPLAAVDTDNIVRWRARPDVIGELFSVRAPTPAEHEAWFRALQQRSDRVEFVILAAGRPVGTVGLSEIDFGSHTAEYGILIGEDDARGQGVARAASELVLEYAFSTLGMKRIDLTLFADNASARRLYESLGFGDVRQLPVRDKDGRQRPVEMMSLTRPA